MPQRFVLPGGRWLRAQLHHTTHAIQPHLPLDQQVRHWLRQGRTPMLAVCAFFSGMAAIWLIQLALAPDEPALPQRASVRTSAASPALAPVAPTALRPATPPLNPSHFVPLPEPSERVAPAAPPLESTSPEPPDAEFTPPATLAPQQAPPAMEMSPPAMEIAPPATEMPPALEMPDVKAPAETLVAPPEPTPTPAPAPANPPTPEITAPRAPADATKKAHEEGQPRKMRPVAGHDKTHIGAATPHPTTKKTRRAAPIIRAARPVRHKFVLPHSLSPTVEAPPAKPAV